MPSYDIAATPCPRWAIPTHNGGYTGWSAPAAKRNMKLFLVSQDVRAVDAMRGHTEVSANGSALGLAKAQNLLGRGPR